MKPISYFAVGPFEAVLQGDISDVVGYWPDGTRACICTVHAYPPHINLEFAQWMAETLNRMSATAGQNQHIEMGDLIFGR